jgi:hypothetical protein
LPAESWRSWLAPLRPSRWAGWCFIDIPLQTHGHRPANQRLQRWFSRWPSPDNRGGAPST